MTRFSTIALAFVANTALSPLVGAISMNSTSTAELEDTCWDDLNPTHQAAFMVLGYDEEMWNSVDFFHQVAWGDLPVEERAVIAAEGYDQHSWNHEVIGGEMNRRLNALIDEQAFAMIVDACWFEKYNLTLFVETDTIHLDVIAVPLESNVAGCMDALTFDDFGAGIKLASFATDLYLEEGWKSDALSLGTFSMSQISDAVDDADVLDPDLYDVVLNNCATFILDIMDFLDIEVTKEVKRYVVNQLAKNDKFVDEVRQSPHAIEIIQPSDIIDAGTRLTDKDIMWRLVSHYVDIYNIM